MTDPLQEQREIAADGSTPACDSCEKFRKPVPDHPEDPGRAYELCMGQSFSDRPVRLFDVNNFRKKQGFPEFDRLPGPEPRGFIVNSRPHGVENTPPRIPAPPRPRSPGEVGSHLKDIFHSLGVDSDACGACVQTLNEMNAAGASGCRARRSEFLTIIRGRAAGVSALKVIMGAGAAFLSGLAWTVSWTDPLGGMFDEAIRRAEAELAELPKLPPPVAPEPILTLPAVPAAPTPPQNAPKSPTWAYGVISTPHRSNDLLPKTIASLAASGFDRPIVSVDGCSDLGPYKALGVELIARSQARGNFGNWFLTALEVYNSNPWADLYAMFEDDLVISRGAREYLERTCVATDVYYNLFSAPSNQKRVRPEFVGWFDSNQRGLGAVGLVFRSEVFQTLLADKVLLNHARDKQRGKECVDGAIVTVMANHVIIEQCHSPSIVQHVGDVSVLKHGKFPAARSFKGEEFDLRELIR